MRNLSKEFNETPEDVIWVWSIRLSCKYVGQKTMLKIDKIINENPEYFEWEHKYKSIPKEVHEAFQNECYPKTNPPSVFYTGEEYKKNLEDFIAQKEPEQPLTNEIIMKIIGNIHDIEMKRLEEEKIERNRVKVIWNKHYSKYKLEYR